MSETLLEVKDLRTYFYTESGTVKAVDGVDFSIRPNETLGMVGESGCGKSVSSLSVMRLVDRPGRIVDGELFFRGENLLKKGRKAMQKIRGDEISMIFQEPMTSLNPVHTIGDQIVEALVLHQKLNKRDAKRKAVDMLTLVGLPAPEQRVDEYPYQLSGGMRQRAMIAMALSCNPSLLIADEPTTALDVTIQAQILDLMRRLKQDIGAAVLIITHDLGVVAEMADNVVVLYAGKVVEYADVKRLFRTPLHPYTRALLASIPQITDRRGRKLLPIEGSIPDPLHQPEGCKFHPRCRYALEMCQHEEPALLHLQDGRQVRCWMYAEEKASDFSDKQREVETSLSVQDTQHVRQREEGAEAILKACRLKMHFPITGGVFNKVVGHVKAVDDVSFQIIKGETLGMVGESGCGKTTTGRMLLRLLQPTEGDVYFEGKNIFALGKRDMQAARRDMQIIFQDPFASLNPRMTVGEIVGEAFKIHGGVNRKGIADKVATLLDLVGLQPNAMKRYPHQFSGGQRQRIGIARAIGLNPKLIVCDEPVSALDVSIQAQIINLLQDLQDKLRLTYLFIAHDLSVVKQIADRVAVMYLGKIAELGGTESVFDSAQHPYTEALLTAVPAVDTDNTGQRKQRIILQGDVPSPSNPPSGCHFHPRCPSVMPLCREKAPELLDMSGGHLVSCHLRHPSVM
ncbi:MAG: ABC transporter ATP-binding protein [bacterium]|nr:ABC transporter ATP-binding protein [bacterium]